MRSAGQCAAGGVVFGVLAARFVLVGSWVSLLPWAATGVIIGWLSVRGAARNGAAYGFALSMAFLIAGYDGHTSVLGLLGFFTVLGLLGAACGTALAWLGQRLPRVQQ